MNLIQIRKLSTLLINNLLDCLQKAAILKKLLFASNTFDEKPNGWRLSYIYIKESLFNEFITSLSNLIYDKQKKSVSYKKLYDAIRLPSMKSLLQADYEKIDPESKIHIGNSSPEIKECIRQRIENDRLAEQILNYKKLYKKVVKDGKDLTSSDMALKIKRFRHQISSHYVYTHCETGYRQVKPEDIQITWGDPFKLFGEVEKNILDIYLLINNTGYSISYFKKDCEESASDFFKSF